MDGTVSQVRANSGTGRPRPRGVRRFLPLVVAAWVVLEIWLLIAAAQLIGWFGLLCLLIASAVLGGWVIKRAGLRALRSTAAGMRGGAPSGDPVTSETRTAVLIAGGLLLILPGLLSDVLGLACLFPPTSALLRRIPERLLRRSGPLGDAYRLQEQLRIHRPDGKVVPGEVIVGEVVDPPSQERGQEHTPEDPYGYGGGRDQLR
ncbi:UPF0716 protein FxsA [Streptacidiphilus sp. MAP12-16]